MKPLCRSLIVAALLALGFVAFDGSAGSQASASPGGGTPAAAGSQKQESQTVRAAFVRLVGDTQRLTPRLGTKKARRSLARAASKAGKLAGRRPCQSLKLLNGYRRQLRALGNAQRRKGGGRRGRAAKRRRFSAQGLAPGDLQADALNAQGVLLGGPATKACGGAEVSAAPAAKATVLKSDAKQLELRVSLPAAAFVGRSGNGQPFTQLSMGDLALTGHPGDPGTPSLGKSFAVPDGATVSISTRRSSSYSIRGVDLYPQQRQPVDGPAGGLGNDPKFADKPFTINRAAYRGGMFPSAAQSTAVLGQMRDIRVGNLQIAGAQYQPRTHRLKVYTSVIAKITFGGASQGSFATGRVGDVWNQPFTELYRNVVMNFGAVNAGLPPPPQVSFCGEEMLVVTSALLRPAADAFAAARSNAGILARVVEVGSGPYQIGTTNTKIQQFIQQEVKSRCRVRPSYVVLVGNTGNVPTMNSPAFGTPPNTYTIPSDHGYSLDPASGDVFPDVWVGRLPAADLATANAEVMKIVGYETTPPVKLPPVKLRGDLLGPQPFYNQMTVASYFQARQQLCVADPKFAKKSKPNCDAGKGPVNGLLVNDPHDSRGYVRISEQVRNHLQEVGGNQVDRIYTTDPNADPQQDDLRVPLPADLRRPGFAWNGTGDDIVNAWNEGRSLILHRDHGYGDKPAFGTFWHKPRFDPSHVRRLHNGTKLPVVFAINCSSGAFDDPVAPSVDEQLVEKAGGGAVAAIGASRTSPSAPNDYLAQGSIDALYPGLIADHKAAKPLSRLGAVLAAGKQNALRAYSVSGRSVDNEAIHEAYLYNLFGDPSTEMWRHEPRRLSDFDVRYQAPPVGAGSAPGPIPYQVKVTISDPGVEGTFATLTRNGEPIGRAVIRDGQAVISPEVDGDNQGLGVSLQQDGFLPSAKSVAAPPPPVASPPPPPPPGARQPSALSQQCPNGGRSGLPLRVGGNLSPNRAGASVDVTYTRPNGSTLVDTVQTDPSGNWTDAVTPQRGEEGNWTVRSRFAGDTTFQPADSSTCTVPVTQGG